ncbi:hypothetical protein SAMN05443244_0921 [Terriglobus roseus]|uniref:Uncharacterized protein n=1 Tax=Terriglobus roseus TaxID=392734 RepID=A0A1H4JZS1_9BACT|nr:hypothetical protein SAMN05443244_0921 [Terriglobus roseus]
MQGPHPCRHAGFLCAISTHEPFVQARRRKRESHPRIAWSSLMEFPKCSTSRGGSTSMRLCKSGFLVHCAQPRQIDETSHRRNETIPLVALVLITGTSNVLMGARARILESQSYRTAIALGLEQLRASLLSGAPALVVVCSSYSLPDRLIATRMVNDIFPALPTVTLMRGSEDDQDFPGETLSVGLGPTGLLEEVQRLTRTRVSTSEA